MFPRSVIAVPPTTTYFCRGSSVGRGRLDQADSLRYPCRMHEEYYSIETSTLTTNVHGTSNSASCISTVVPVIHKLPYARKVEAPFRDPAFDMSDMIRTHDFSISIFPSRPFRRPVDRRCIYMSRAKSLAYPTSTRPSCNLSCILTRSQIMMRRCPVLRRSSTPRKPTCMF